MGGGLGGRGGQGVTGATLFSAECPLSAQTDRARHRPLNLSCFINIPWCLVVSRIEGQVWAYAAIIVAFIRCFFFWPPLLSYFFIFPKMVVLRAKPFTLTHCK